MIYVSASTQAPTITITALINGALQTVVYTTSDTTLQAGWNFVWFNGRLTGQNFTPIISFTGSNPSPIKIKELWYEFTTSGKQRN